MVTGTRCPCHACQLPCKQTEPYTTSRAQHYETPGVFTPPSRAAHLRWLSQAQLLGWHWGGQGRGLGMASTPGAACSLLSLGWAWGSRAGRAWRKQSWTCCTRPGMLRELHTCLTQVLPAPLSRHHSPARLQPWPFSPGLQTARGGCAPTPGSIPQERGMGQSIQPFPGRVEIIPTEPFPSSLGISRQVCDSPGHLGKAWVILQPQGSNRSLPLHLRRDFLGKPGWDLGGAGMLAAPPHPLTC